MNKTNPQKKVPAKLKKGSTIRCKIRNQGAPLVNGGYIVEIGKNIVALEIDMRSKHCNICGVFSGSDGSLGIGVIAGENSMHLNNKVPVDEATFINFPDFNGWRIFACDIARYTLSVCLVKKGI